MTICYRSHLLREPGNSYWIIITCLWPSSRVSNGYTLQGVNSPITYRVWLFDWHTEPRCWWILHGIFVKCIFGKHHPRKLQTFASGLIWEKIPRYFQMFLCFNVFKTITSEKKTAGHLPVYPSSLKAQKNRWWSGCQRGWQQTEAPWGWRSAQVQRLPFNDRWLQIRHSDEPLKHETIDRALRRWGREGMPRPDMEKKVSRFPKFAPRPGRLKNTRIFSGWLNVFM